MQKNLETLIDGHIDTPPTFKTVPLKSTPQLLRLPVQRVFLLFWKKETNYRDQERDDLMFDTIPLETVSLSHTHRVTNSRRNTVESTTLEVIPS